MVEDSEDDALLILRQLRRDGMEPEWMRVDTEDALRAALHRRSWDIILADYSMPTFTGPAALAVVKELGLDVPFLIVSGTVGEETAVEAMRAGANDYLLKDRLIRLVPAIERELRDAAMRRDARRAHDQLLVSERMASVGTLAAGVAHEINNPLAALLANLQIITQSLSDLVSQAHVLAGDHRPACDVADPLVRSLGELLEPLGDARHAAQRVRQIVRDLSLFSRIDDDRRGPVDLNQVLDSTLRLVSTEVRHRARLIKDYGDAPLVESNESRLGQVFLNLIVNAAQSIPVGAADDHEIRLSTRRTEDGRAMVEVSDTGSGIPPSVLPRIFDPFFTTKPVGQGTGLGLPICHRIVNGLGGEISVDTVPGRGTVFRVILPAAEGPSVDSAPASTAGPVVRRGRVLVIDDEELLIRAVVRMLEEEYEVEGLIDAREAFERIRGGERFDVILCDLMMARMSGMDLYAEVKGAAPDQAVKIVFMSGGAFSDSAQEFLAEVPNPRIEKPFDATELRAIMTPLLPAR